MQADSPRENTYVFDPESPQELARLIDQDRFVTRSMGGPLKGLPELPEGAHILDLACGPGSWVLDVAFDLPDATVSGVDISRAMIDYANARTTSQGLTNASFGVMDITQPLDFADQSFDLINARTLFGVLQRTAWPSFVAECTRLLRPGGILRLTELDDLGISTSPALEQLTVWGTQALWHAGYGFSPQGRTVGMSPAFLNLFKQAGYQDIHVNLAPINGSADSEYWSDGYHNNQVIYAQMKPLITTKLELVTPETYEQVYQQMFIEMHAADFACLWHVTSVWGSLPTND